MSKYGRRFFISCLLSSVLMYGISYLWHGVILNDYVIMNFPKGIFLTAAAFVYLFIGVLVSRAFLFPQLDKISRHPLARGPIAGALVGLLMFMIVMVVGAAFTRSSGLQDIVLNLGWQVVEQAFGGFFVGLVYMFVYEPMPFPIHPEEEEE